MNNSLETRVSNLEEKIKDIIDDIHKLRLQFNSIFNPRVQNYSIIDIGNSDTNIDKSDTNIGNSDTNIGKSENSQLIFPLSPHILKKK